MSFLERWGRRFAIVLGVLLAGVALIRLWGLFTAPRVEVPPHARALWVERRTEHACMLDRHSESPLSSLTCWPTEDAVTDVRVLEPRSNGTLRSPVPWHPEEFAVVLPPYDQPRIAYSASAVVFGLGVPATRWDPYTRRPHQPLRRREAGPVVHGTSAIAAGTGVHEHVAPFLDDVNAEYADFDNMKAEVAGQIAGVLAQALAGSVCEPARRLSVPGYGLQDGLRCYPVGTDITDRQALRRRLDQAFDTWEEAPDNDPMDLAEALLAEEAHERWAGAWMLGSNGEPMLPILVAAAEHSDASVRATACAGIGWVGPGAVDASPALVARFSDPDPQVREMALVAFQRIGAADPSAIPALGDMAATPGNGALQLLAMRNLLRLGEEGRGTIDPGEVEALLLSDELDVMAAASEVAARVGVNAEPAFERAIEEAIAGPRVDRLRQLRDSWQLPLNAAEERLLLAARSGDLDAARQCLEEGARIGVRDTHGHTAAVIAEQRGHAGFLQLLSEEPL